MSQPMGYLPGLLAAERKHFGTTRLLLGFVIGALFGLLPMYYIYMGKDTGRDGALRGANGAQDQPLTPAGEPRSATGDAVPSARGSKPFASRMTYELSQLPEDRTPAPAKETTAPTVAVVSTPVRPAAIVSLVPPAPAPADAPELPDMERVVNARPISALPPDPRDTTREIEKEARKPEYREPARQQAKAPPAPVGRVIEGRQVELKAPRLPDMPSRPIVANASVDTRAEIEAERQLRALQPALGRAVAITAPEPVKKEKGTQTRAAAVAPGPPVAGVSPIASAPETTPRSESLSQPKPSASAPADQDGAEANMQSRLQATRDWLAAAPQTTHTIQLLGTNSEEQLKSHLKSLSKVLEANKLYVFRTLAQGKPSITVVYGSYADRQSALQALEKLPAALTANRPVLRTVNGIRTEIKQNGTRTDS